mgnify:CR=1 FL=1
MRGFFAGLVVLAACGPPTVRVAGVTLQLHTPADVDPLAGADTLFVRVLDADGNEVESASGAPGGTVPLPPITTFGEVEIEVTARANGEVLSAARSGPVRVDPRDELVVDVLFLPINQAVPLQWTPTAHRIGHTAVNLPDGRVLLMGGRTPSSATLRADSELWSPATGFAGEGPVLPQGMRYARQATLPNGVTLVAGGEGAPQQVLAVEDADDELSIRALTPLRSATTTPCIVTHPTLGGAVVLTGSTLEFYSAEGRVGSEDFAASDVEACAGSQGYVVTAGGTEGWGIIDLSTEEDWPFDLTAQTTWLPNLPALDGPQVVAPDPDDDLVWVGGGYGFDASVGTRLVDPSRREVDPAEDLTTGRTGAQAAPWRDGTVVLAGGWSDDVRSAPVRSVVIHDPAQGDLLDIQIPATDPTLSVLAGGALLLTGGVDDAGEAAGAIGIVPWVEEQD